MTGTNGTATNVHLSALINGYDLTLLILLCSFRHHKKFPLALRAFCALSITQHEPVK